MLLTAVSSTALKGPFKVILVGPSSAGKTSFAYFAKTQRELACPTSSINSTLHGHNPPLVDIVVLDERTPYGPVQLCLWDTAGQEVFNSLTKSYFHGADAVLVMFDVSDPESYRDAWNMAAQSVEVFDIPHRYVIGMKSDLPAEQRAVPSAQGVELSESLRAKYFEASAVKGFKVREIIQDLSAALAGDGVMFKWKMQHQQAYNGGLDLESNPTVVSHPGCCSSGGHKKYKTE